MSSPPLPPCLEQWLSPAPDCGVTAPQRALLPALLRGEDIRVGTTYPHRGEHFADTATATAVMHTVAVAVAARILREHALLDPLRIVPEGEAYSSVARTAAWTGEGQQRLRVLHVVSKSSVAPRYESLRASLPKLSSLAWADVEREKCPRCGTCGNDYTIPSTYLAQYDGVTCSAQGLAAACDGAPECGRLPLRSFVRAAADTLLVVVLDGLDAAARDAVLEGLPRHLVQTIELDPVPRAPPAAHRSWQCPVRIAILPSVALLRMTRGQASAPAVLDAVLSTVRHPSGCTLRAVSACARDASAAEVVLRREGVECVFVLGGLVEAAGWGRAIAVAEAHDVTLCLCSPTAEECGPFVRALEESYGVTVRLVDPSGPGSGCGGGCVSFLQLFRT